MSVELVAVPKPEPKPKKEPKRLRAKKPMKQRNEKRQGSMFPKRRDRAYTDWLRTDNPCILAGHLTRRALTVHDVPSKAAEGIWQHRCRGRIDPAHVDRTRGAGAGDVGECVPLCRDAHRFFDDFEYPFYTATGLDRRKLKHMAEGYVVKYVERGGRLAADDEAAA